MKEADIPSCPKCGGDMLKGSDRFLYHREFNGKCSIFNMPSPELYEETKKSYSPRPQHKMMGFDRPIDKDEGRYLKSKK